ncbi:Uncharacterised protein g2404 [Pycnogonum litorale]
MDSALSYFAIYVVVAFGLISGQDSKGGLCRCNIRRIHENGSFYGNGMGISNVATLSDCNSPTAEQDCRYSCDHEPFVKFLNMTNGWEEKSTDEAHLRLGDYFCRYIFQRESFRRLKLQNYYQVCVKNEWKRGNILSEPLSCKDGKMV